MKEENLLISKGTIKAYLGQMKKFKELGNSKEGDQFFIKQLIVETEQIDNLHVKNKIEGFQLECDEGEELGGSNKAPNPMQMLISSLATCSLLSVVMFFTVMKLNVEHVKLELSAKFDMRGIINPKNREPPGLNDFHFKWFIKTEVPLSKIKKIIKRAEKMCPIRGTIERSNFFSQEIILNN